MTELAPVVTQSQFNPLIFWPLIVIVGLIIGLLYWHRKNPSAEAKALKEASAGAKVTIEHIIEVLHDVREALAGKAEAPIETLEKMAGGTLPDGWGLSMGEGGGNPFQPSVPQIPGTTEDKAALLAARTYRVSLITFGPHDPRTDQYLSQLTAIPHWPDALTFAGGAGLDRTAEAQLADSLRNAK